MNYEEYRKTVCEKCESYHAECDADEINIGYCMEDDKDEH